MPKKLLLGLVLIVAVFVGYGQVRRARAKAEARQAAAAELAKGAATKSAAPVASAAKPGTGFPTTAQVEAAKTKVPHSVPVGLGQDKFLKDLPPQALAALKAQQEQHLQPTPAKSGPTKEVPAAALAAAQSAAKRWCGEGRCGGCQSALVMMPAADRPAQAAAACAQGCTDLCAAQGKAPVLLPPVMGPTLSSKMNSIKKLEVSNGAH